jgi:hypothetical protein
MTDSQQYCSEPGVFCEYLPVNIYEEYCDSDENPTHAKVELTIEEIKHILKVKKSLKRIGIDIARKYYCLNYYTMLEESTQEYQEVEFRIDCQFMEISDTYLAFNFCIKDTSITGEVESILIKDLELFIKIYEMPLEDLPTLINTEYRLKTIKDLIDKRLHGEIVT